MLNKINLEIKCINTLISNLNLSSKYELLRELSSSSNSSDLLNSWLTQSFILCELRSLELKELKNESLKLELENKRDEFSGMLKDIYDFIIPPSLILAFKNIFFPRFISNNFNFTAILIASYADGKVTDLPGLNDVFFEKLHSVWPMNELGSVVEAKLSLFALMVENLQCKFSTMVLFENSEQLFNKIFADSGCLIKIGTSSISPTDKEINSWRECVKKPGIKSMVIEKEGLGILIGSAVFQISPVIIAAPLAAAALPEKFILVDPEIILKVENDFTTLNLEEAKGCFDIFKRVQAQLNNINLQDQIADLFSKILADLRNVGHFIQLSIDKTPILNSLISNVEKIMLMREISIDIPDYRSMSLLSSDCKYAFSSFVPRGEKFVIKGGWKSKGGKYSDYVLGISAGKEPKNFNSLKESVKSITSLSPDINSYLDNWAEMVARGKFNYEFAPRLVSTIYNDKNIANKLDSENFLILENMLDLCLSEQAGLVIFKTSGGRSDSYPPGEVELVNSGTMFNIRKMISPGIKDGLGQVLVPVKVEVD